MLLAGLSFSLLAQDSDPVADDAADLLLEAPEDELEELEDFDPSEFEDDLSLEGDDATPMPDDGLDPGEFPDEDMSDAESAGAELSEADMKASMERFVPSEKISEDRPVSFPNDI